MKQHLVVWICSRSRKNCFNVNNFGKILKKSHAKFVFYVLVTNFSKRQFTWWSFLDICRRSSEIVLILLFWSFMAIHFQILLLLGNDSTKKTIETIGVFRTLSKVYDEAFWIFNGWNLFTILTKHLRCSTGFFEYASALGLLINFFRKHIFLL